MKQKSKTIKKGAIMKKRTIFLALTLFVAIISTKAQQSIYVEEVGGNITQTLLSDVQKISFSGTDMILEKTDATTLTWAISDVQKYYYDVSTDVNEIDNDNIYCVIYPNPSAGSFKVDYQLNKKETVVFSIFSLNGKLLTQKNNDNISAGKHTLYWNCDLPAGTYIVKILKGKNLTTKKLIILK